MEEYLCILITHNNARTYILTQPHLIDRIIKSVPSMKDAMSVTTPAAAGKILTKDLEGEKRNDHWSYRSGIGMLDYLIDCTHPGILFAVHQCARFCNDPKYSLEQAIKIIIRYLIRTT